MSPPDSTVEVPPSLPPPADTLGHPGFSTVDIALRSLEWANIAFNRPDSMILGQMETIELVLSPKISLEALKDTVQARGNRQGTQVRVGNRMEARLTGPGFDISAVTDEFQAIGSGLTRWAWDVRPTRSGLQQLHLTLSARLDIEGHETPYTVQTFDALIQVRVTLRQRVERFVRDNWQWLWAVVVVPIAGLLWGLRKKPPKATKRPKAQ